jgi:hypothetical protein
MRAYMKPKSSAPTTNAHSKGNLKVFNAFNELNVFQYLVRNVIDFVALHAEYYM